MYSAKAAIDVLAREARLVAQVLLTALAVLTSSAGRIEPGHTYPVPQGKARHPRAQGIHPADDLMARYHRQLGQGDFALHQVQVGVAHAAGLHLQTHLA